ncbi:MAG: glycosyltransferase [Segetibacter sp.]
MLEAMIAGKPIVASDIPGVSELITEADCGLLFEKGNVQELADKMIRIMFFSNEERIRLGEKGRQFIIENYAEDKIMQQWVDIIEKVKLG